MADGGNGNGGSGTGTNNAAIALLLYAWKIVRSTINREKLAGLVRILFTVENAKEMTFLILKGLQLKVTPYKEVAGIIFDLIALAIYFHIWR